MGALAHALTTINRAHWAVAAMRCGDARLPIAQALERLRIEHLTAETRPLFGDLHSALLLCADRVNDATRPD